LAKIAEYCDCNIGSRISEEAAGKSELLTVVVSAFFWAASSLSYNITYTMVTHFKPIHFLHLLLKTAL
jgi:hypothetical protein